MAEIKTPEFLGTGRRKTAVARVRLASGSGKITVNGRAFDTYFPLETLRSTVSQPLTVTGTPDLDITANGTVTIYASKVGATVGDAVTFDVGLYNQVVGALHDADTNFGGTSGAMTGNATSKTVQAVTLTITAANWAASPAGVTLTLKPTDTTLGTDDLCLERVRITYKKKILTS